jgi:glycosyltransferase involved in cell wall biosynthesis
MDIKISIVITARNYSQNLLKTIRSINNQNFKPKEIIIVSNNYILQDLNFDNKIKIKKFTSKIKNQVFQRNIAINNLSKDTNIILQIDDRIILRAKCLHELNKFWKKTDKSVIGVGLNQVNRLKDTSFLTHLIRDFKLKGMVLANGMNIDYFNAKKDFEVMWLKGGLSSWKVDKNTKIKNRQYPFWSWSVFEDVDFSLDKKKNTKLFVAHKAKIDILKKKIKNINFKELLYKGSLFTYAQKLIVKKYFRTTIFFYLTMPFLIFLNLIFSILTYNRTSFFYNLGRIKGFFIINFN